MLKRLIHFPFLRRMLTLCVEYHAGLQPAAGSDWYGEQHLAVEIERVRVIEVEGEPLDYRKRGHYVACEWFLWEAHANDLACRVIEKHVRSGE